MAESEAEAEAAVKRKAPTWAEALEMEKRLSLIGKESARLCRMTQDESFLSLSEADREAEEARIKEQRVALIREFLRLSYEKRDPDFSGMSEADRAAEAERLRQEVLEHAARLKMAGFPDALRREGVARIIDFDPKQRGRYYNRSCHVDTTKFSHDDESPFRPMRHTHRVFENNKVEVGEAVNIFSVKIASSDVGFPIQVYGTVIARDSIDHKCVSLFRRDRDHCQLIKSKTETLILTGPKRGLVLLSDNYVETDLKIKDYQGQDRELSKGMVTIEGISHRSLEKCEVGRESLATRLSTVDVYYAVVIGAVEATIGVRVFEGKFHGTITAHTTSIKKRFVLYDSKVAGTKTRGVGVIRLMRRVVSVYGKDMLIIELKTTDGKSFERIDFTPKGNSANEAMIAVGSTKMGVMVAWSIMDP